MGDDMSGSYFPGFSPDDQTVREARAYLREHFDDGVKCPCCSQLVKRYRRKLYGSMAASLLVLYKLCRGETDRWCHKGELLDAAPSYLVGTLGGGDFAKLSYWQLIEELPRDPDADTRTSGTWRLTDHGYKFARRMVSVPSHVLVYNGCYRGYDGDPVSIDNCLGSKFSYSELMGWTDG